MLTQKKIDIYIKYSGDIDAFTIAGKKKEKAIMNDKDWKFIDDLVFDLIMINRNLTSSEMKSKVEKLIEENFDREEAKELLLTFAKNQS